MADALQISISIKDTRRTSACLQLRHAIRLQSNRTNPQHDEHVARAMHKRSQPSPEGRCRRQEYEAQRKEDPADRAHAIIVEASGELRALRTDSEMQKEERVPRGDEGWDKEHEEEHVLDGDAKGLE